MSITKPIQLDVRLDEEAFRPEEIRQWKPGSVLVLQAPAKGLVSVYANGQFVGKALLRVENDKYTIQMIDSEP